MKKWMLCVCSMVLSASLQAAALDFVGTIPVAISDDPSSPNALVSKPHMVYVQKIVLSPEAQRVLGLRVTAVLHEAQDKKLTALPERVNLGMNNTPVLDQGEHGTCVTFSVTGAIDAVIGKGDYVSQLCSLELGSYLVGINETNSSGWNGSWGNLILSRLNTYGLFPKSYQLSHGCAGVKKYPLSPESNTGKPMPIAEYTAHSEALFSYVSWVDLANSEAVFNVNFNPTNLLNVVKDHLNKGQRIVFGTLIDPTQGNAGAAGTKQKRYDSWVLNDVIRKKAKKGALNAGHEMIIIGYDDNATSRDSDGVVSKGLLILRNSWGSQAGDGGTFYMSYDYFKTLADEAQAIVSNDDLR